MIDVYNGSSSYWCLLWIKQLPQFKTHNMIRLKEKVYVSKLVTDWKTWPKCIFLTVPPPPAPRAADVSNLGQSQLCSVWNMELYLWMNKIQDRTQSWRSLLYSVLLCLLCLFMLCLSCIFVIPPFLLCTSNRDVVAEQARKRLKWPWC